MTSQTSPKSSQRTAVVTAAAPAALPFLSQAITCQGMVYCSGQLPIDPSTGEVVRGSIADRVVSRVLFPTFAYTIHLRVNNGEVDLTLPCRPFADSTTHTGTMPRQHLGRALSRRIFPREHGQDDHLPYADARFCRSQSDLYACL